MQRPLLGVLILYLTANDNFVHDWSRALFPSAEAWIAVSNAKPSQYRRPREKAALLLHEQRLLTQSALTRRMPSALSMSLSTESSSKSDAKNITTVSPDDGKITETNDKQPNSPTPRLPLRIILGRLIDTVEGMYSLMN
jgi:hypothetical protein